LRQKTISGKKPQKSQGIEFLLNKLEAIERKGGPALPKSNKGDRPFDKLT
jgi:hypothetical protein